MIAGVPYDAEIEYLESALSQYIDTGVTYNDSNSYRFEMRAVFTQSYFKTYQFCGWDAGGQWGVYGDVLANGGTIADAPTIVNKTIDCVLAVEQGGSSNTVLNYSVEGVSGTATRAHGSLTTYAGNSGWLLFACASQGGVGYRCAMRIMYAKVFRNNTLVRDLIPVRVGQVGYMYDRVTRKLFSNAGTGSFVLGPDVATPVMGLRRYPQIGGAA